MSDSKLSTQTWARQETEKYKNKEESVVDKIH